MAAEPTPRERAEELFGELLARSGAGEAAFAALLELHPDLDAELRLLWREWEGLAALRGALDAEGRRRWSPGGFPRDAQEEPADTPEDLVAHIRRRRRTIERYRYLGEVGRGGMGAVLRVHDHDLKRDLAMKVMLDGGAPRADAAGGGSRTLGRFLEEAQVTGQLDHPGIVPVHEVGLDAEGRVFFTMKLVRGRDLGRVLELVAQEREGWSRARALGVVLKVCEAMSYAHAKGVVHRDLKPSNVMVGSFGAVYVMDWGLARVVGRSERSAGASGVRTVRTASDTGSALATVEGDVVGTPAYMSPEQARGEAGRIGPASDVYAIGAMLYHLSAGRMPYADGAADRATVLARARAGPPPPLSLLAADAPAELVAITEKAMARAPEERYATMQELALDLRAFLEGRVVRAYRTGAFVELSKWVGRNRALAGSIAAGLFLALLGLGSAVGIQAASNERLAAVNRQLEQGNVALGLARDEAVQSEELASRRAEEAERERRAADRVVDFLVGLFESPAPQRTRGADVSVGEILDRGVAAIEAERALEPAVRARLLEAMGSAYGALGRYDESLPLLEEGLAIRSIENASDPALARAQVLVWATKDRLGDLEAPARLRAIADELTATLGPRHPETLAARHAAILAVVGDARHEVGERIDALLPDVLAVRGEESEIYLALLSTKAATLFASGRMEEAEAAHREALALNRRVLGEDHPLTVQALANLASFYYRIDEIPEATELFEEAVALERRVFGEDHVALLVTLGSLAHCYALHGRSQEAEALFVEVLERYERHFGEDHDDTLLARINLSTQLLRNGRLDEAEEHVLRAHERVTSRHGPDHPYAIVCLQNLGQIARLRGDADAAEGLLREALDGQRRIYGPSHLETLELVWILADFLRQEGRLEEALPLADELVRKTPPENVRYEGRVRMRDEIAGALGVEPGG